MFFVTFVVENLSTKMEVVVNNLSHIVESQTLLGLINELQIESRGVAIAINGRVVPQLKWGEASLHDGDKIVVVSAVFGG